MAKQKKKRNKKYHGEDAKRERPIIKKVVVEDKSKFREWIDDNKTELKIRGAQLSFVAILGLIIYGIIIWIF